MRVNIADNNVLAVHGDGCCRGALPAGSNRWHRLLKLVNRLFCGLWPSDYGIGVHVADVQGKTHKIYFFEKDVRAWIRQNPQHIDQSLLAGYTSLSRSCLKDVLKSLLEQNTDTAADAGNDVDDTTGEEERDTAAAPSAGSIVPSPIPNGDSAHKASNGSSGQPSINTTQLVGAPSKHNALTQSASSTSPTSFASSLATPNDDNYRLQQYQRLHQYAFNNFSDTEAQSLLQRMAAHEARPDWDGSAYELDLHNFVSPSIGAGFADEAVLDHLVQADIIYAWSLHQGCYYIKRSADSADIPRLKLLWRDKGAVAASRLIDQGDASISAPGFLVELGVLYRALTTPPKISDPKPCFALLREIARKALCHEGVFALDQWYYAGLDDIDAVLDQLTRHGAICGWALDSLGTYHIKNKGEATGFEQLAWRDRLVIEGEDNTPPPPKASLGDIYKQLQGAFAAYNQSLPAAEQLPEGHYKKLLIAIARHRSSLGDDSPTFMIAQKYYPTAGRLDESLDHLVQAAIIHAWAVDSAGEHYIKLTDEPASDQLMWRGAAPMGPRQPTLGADGSPAVGGAPPPAIVHASASRIDDQDDGALDASALDLTSPSDDVREYCLRTMATLRAYEKSVAYKPHPFAEVGRRMAMTTIFAKMAQCELDPQWDGAIYRIDHIVYSTSRDILDHCVKAGIIEAWAEDGNDCFYIKKLPGSDNAGAGGLLWHDSAAIASKPTQQGCVTQ